MKAPYRNRIAFISSYCDRWCEHCAFTTRCSDYAVEVAAAMCGGDYKAGLELAIGAPPPMTREEEKRRERFVEKIMGINPPSLHWMRSVRKKTPEKSGWTKTRW